MALRTFVACIVGLCLAASPAQAEVMLGSPTFLPVPYAEGFGEVSPEVVYNGGVPSGLIKAIEWSGWGERTASGAGRKPIYRPNGGYYAAAARVRLKATSPGACPAEAGEFYRLLLVRVPLWPDGPLGPWQSWSGNDSLCGGGLKVHWESPGGGGYCGYTGEYGAGGEAKSIMASRIDCPAARRIVKRSQSEVSPAPSFGPRRFCGRRGCRVRIHGFRCRFHPIRLDDYADSEGAPLSEPLQRVSCKRGRAGIIWWYTHYFD